MVGGNVNCAVTIENSMEVPLKKLKIELSCHLAILLLGIYLWKTNLKRCIHLDIHSITVYKSQDTKMVYQQMNG